MAELTSEDIERNVEKWHDFIQIGISKQDSYNEREYKGNSLIAFPDRFVVLDIETTGYNSSFCEIIEVSALRVDNDNVVDRFSTLIKPSEPINNRISELTGITNEMLVSAPVFADIEDELRNFLGDEIIVGHNINFDINFLYDNFSKPFSNDFVDTLRISRKLLPDLEHHKLQNLADYYGVDYSNAHRAEADCIITLECYRRMKEQIFDKYSTLAEFTCEKSGSHKKKSYSKVKASDLSKDENSSVDENNYLFGKVCVFTGELKIDRRKAMQLVLNIGGALADNVTKKTNILIVGDNESLGHKSSKEKKAEEYIAKGQDLEIISENKFYEIMGL